MVLQPDVDSAGDIGLRINTNTSASPRPGTGESDGPESPAATATSPTAAAGGGINTSGARPSEISKSMSANEDFSFPVYQIFYDFKPTGFDDPVLLYFQNK